MSPKQKFKLPDWKKVKISEMTRKKKQQDQVVKYTQKSLFFSPVYERTTQVIINKSIGYKEINTLSKLFRSHIL